MTNASVLEQIAQTGSLEAAVAKQKPLYFSHIMRGKNGIESEIMLGMVDDKRRR